MNSSEKLIDVLHSITVDRKEIENIKTDVSAINSDITNLNFAVDTSKERIKDAEDDIVSLCNDVGDISLDLNSQIGVINGALSQKSDITDVDRINNKISQLAGEVKKSSDEVNYGVNVTDIVRSINRSVEEDIDKIPSKSINDSTEDNPHSVSKENFDLGTNKYTWDAASKEKIITPKPNRTKVTIDKDGTVKINAPSITINQNKALTNLLSDILNSGEDEQ